VTLNDELKQLRDWIEEGDQQRHYYTKMNYYWNRYEFLCFRFGARVGFAVCGVIAIVLLIVLGR
jgi:hypothetical protein